MAFDTYAALKATVVDWLHRANLAAQVPDFVTLAEAEINRKLGISSKETEVPLVTVIGSRFVVRPTDMSQPIALWLETSQPRKELTAMLPTTLQVDTTKRCAPACWAIDDANIAFEQPTDRAYALTFRYVQDTRLSDANPTNELLQRAPDLYLYGCLAMAMPYTQNDAQVSFWKSEFKRVLREVRIEASRTKAIVPLRTDLPCSSLHTRRI
jgi:hypothetical protein